MLVIPSTVDKAVEWEEIFENTKYLLGKVFVR